MEYPKSVLVLHSGGADSTFMLILALKMGHIVTPLMFNYGQRHAKELEYGRRVWVEIFKRVPNLKGVGRDPIEIDLTGAFAHTRSNLLNVSFAADYKGVHPMHVPARNGVFLFTALSVAESMDYDEIWIGCDFSDRLGLFPDCYQEWIVKMAEIFKVSGSRPVTLKAPLLGLEKQDVLKLLEREGFGIPLDTIYSGYTPPTTASPAPPAPVTDAQPVT